MQYILKRPMKAFIAISMVLVSQYTLPSVYDWINTTPLKSKIYLTRQGNISFSEDNNNINSSVNVTNGSVITINGQTFYGKISAWINNKNANDLPVVKGSGNVVEQQRPSASFNAISSTFPVQIIHTADQNTITLKGEDTILDALKVKIKNNTLTITSKNKDGVCLEPTVSPPVQLRVGLANQEKLSLSGAGKYDLGSVKAHSFNLNVSGSSKVKGDMQLKDHMQMKVSGASNVAMNIIADTLGLNLSGASSVKLSGKVEKQTLDISGASHYKAKKLESATANIKASGASKLRLYVKEKLAGVASGVAKVIYYGNPNSVHVKKSGYANVYKS